jgi:hypothetical protein|tara:strand:+ start:74 stop:307 length:234 start_codon:yes stop_codon:yes gene_type:complete
MGDITPHQKWARETVEGLETLITAARQNKISGYVIAYQVIDGDNYEVQTHAAGEFDDFATVAGNLLVEAIRLTNERL